MYIYIYKPHDTPLFPIRWREKQTKKEKEKKRKENEKVRQSLPSIVRGKVLSVFEKRVLFFGTLFLQSMTKKGAFFS